MCVYVYVCVYVCKCMPIHMYVCVYVCIYVCIYMYAYLIKCQNYKIPKVFFNLSIGPNLLYITGQDYKLLDDHDDNILKPVFFPSRRDHNSYQVKSSTHYTH